MQRVIVTVKRQGEARVRDLEVPAEVEAGRLAEMIAQALHWESDPAGQPVQYEIMAEPPGRVLHVQESLAEAGAWDGAWLVFQPQSDAPPPPPKPTPGPTPVTSAPPDKGPLTGWRSLGIDLPAEPEPQQAATDSKDIRYVWKQVD
jgi:hypothetical protein